MQSYPISTVLHFYGNLWMRMYLQNFNQHLFIRNWHELVEQENKDALSGIPQLLCFAFQLERHISPGSKSFSMNSICKCLIDVSNVFCCLGRIHNTKSVWSTKIFFVWWPQVLDLPGIIEGESLLLPFCSLFCFLVLMSQARKCII